MIVQTSQCHFCFSFQVIFVSCPLVFSITNFHLLLRFPLFVCSKMIAVKMTPFFALDLNTERNAFWEKAYPELQSYCQSLGLVFEVRTEY